MQRTQRLDVSLTLPFAAVWALLAPEAVPADRRPDRSRLSIATFNARFLFDGVAPEGEAGFPWKDDAVSARKHLQSIAALLRPLDADVIHISEVEDLGTLRRLGLEIGDPTYEAYLIPGHDEFTRQNVGLLTRVDPDGPLARTDERAAAHDGEAPQGVPKNYAARITAGRWPLTLVGAHLLAFPEDPERIPRREGQAEVLRRFAAEEGTLRGRLVVLLGDLNDFDPEVPDAAGNLPSSRVLEILKTVDLRTSEDDLWNPAELLPLEERFTAFVDRNLDGRDGGLAERSLTDHVLVSARLRPAVAAIEVLASHDPLGASDHFPLRVVLDSSRAEIFIRGDAAGNGSVGLDDVHAILRHLFAGEPVSCADAADADDDGKLSVTDAIFLLRGILGLEGRLPAPGPVFPGFDPTGDELSPCRG